MTLARWWAALALLLLVAPPARANPCAAARVDGRQVLPPAPMPDISLVDERIKITLHVGADEEGYRTISRKTFQIRYVFHNRGKPADVVIGFPIVIPAFQRPEKAPGGVLTGFRVSGRGVGPRVAPTAKLAGSWVARSDRSFLHFCERIAVDELRKSIAAPQKRPVAFTDRQITFDSHDEAYAVGWYFWRQRFGRGTTRFAVRYEARYAFGICQAAYVLRTARYWGDGAIGRLTVDLMVRPRRQLRGIDAQLVPLKSAVKAKTKTRTLSPIKARPIKHGGGLRWRWKKLGTDRDLVIGLDRCEAG